MASKKNRLMPERIFSTEIQPMDESDIAMFTARRTRMFTFIMSPYFTLAGLLLYKYIDLTLKYRAGTYLKGQPHGELVLSCVFGFCFLMLTGYFIKYFLDELYPIIKDLQEKRKTVLFYAVHKSAMGFFNQYFISTPMYEKQQIRIEQELFDQIQEGELIAIETGVHSDMILHLKHRDRRIDVND